MAEAGTDRSYRVCVPPDFVADLAVPDVDKVRLVGSPLFLLEREQARSVLPEFDLPINGMYFP